MNSTKKIDPKVMMLLNKLYQYITDNKLKIGDKLPTERILAEQFSVSRTTIRKALKILIEKDLIESRQGDGNYLKKPDLKPIEEILNEVIDQKSTLFEQIMEFRNVIEPAIAEIAAQKRTQKHIEQLKLIVFEQQRRKSFNLPADGKLDAAFHLQLARCTGNILFINTVQQINKIYIDGRRDELRDMEWKEFSIREHLEIIDAIENKDSLRCKKLLEKHISTVSNTHYFSKKKDKV